MAYEINEGLVKLAQDEDGGIEEVLEQAVVRRVLTWAAAREVAHDLARGLTEQADDWWIGKPDPIGVARAVWIEEAF